MFQALESKLASCKNFVHNQPRSGKTPASSPMESPRLVFHLHTSLFFNTNQNNFLYWFIYRGGGGNCFVIFEELQSSHLGYIYILVYIAYV